MSESEEVFGDFLKRYPGREKLTAARHELEKIRDKIKENLDPNDPYKKSPREVSERLFQVLKENSRLTREAVDVWLSELDKPAAKYDDTGPSTG